MTTIVFVEKPNRVEIAFDSQVSSGYSHEELEQPKVFTVGPVTIGVAGAVGFANLVSDLHFPEHPKEMTDAETDTYVQRVVIPRLRQAGKSYDPHYGDHDVEGQVLVAVNKRVYSIGGDFARVRNKTGFYVIGSGTPYARTALRLGANAKQAVEAAAQMDLFTGHEIKTMVA